MKINWKIILPIIFISFILAGIYFVFGDFPRRTPKINDKKYIKLLEQCKIKRVFSYGESVGDRYFQVLDFILVDGSQRKFMFIVEELERVSGYERMQELEGNYKQRCGFDIWPPLTP
ncbi:MAG: hypothetical protein COV29_01365 [Candidatus Yanofskybacteria bacterium CG10_big_fil_rev_8_21_14_0_10_36_16]|uniref:Uncharacterized protein n=1 Tax=Candidatus Yanofskybacteria bacterium CG10_big_fil_rev_8_21_14_0_10_36_16 TaxID=1975096 RepID=A0A2J0Q8A2_9BACT|nr:MAG: hypothetical protein COV29_01365 [Candidatus Yanofskybacteria bacterium CG10_big_fil_rev_8_21_14_0_10_36_16]